MSPSDFGSSDGANEVGAFSALLVDMMNRLLAELLVASTTGGTRVSARLAPLSRQILENYGTLDDDAGQRLERLQAKPAPKRSAQPRTALARHCRRSWNDEF